MAPSLGRRFWVGITDRGWYDFLNRQAGLDELNFWMPKGSRRFGALASGEPFLVKLHAPENYIVGGGFFASFSALPCSLAWEAFGIKNGAPTYADMRRRIEKYRGVQESHPDYEIGCIVLVSPFFLDENDWIPVPPTWAPNIVQGKTLSMDDAEDASLWAAVVDRLSHKPVADVIDVEHPMFGARPSPAIDSARVRSASSLPTRMTDAALQPVRRPSPSSRPRTSFPSPTGDGTASTTASSCGPTYTASTTTGT